MPRSHLPLPLQSVTTIRGCTTAAVALGLLYSWLRLFRRRRLQLDGGLSTPGRRSLRALQENLALRHAFQSRIGLDIGGTLAKLVFLTDKTGSNSLEKVNFGSDASKHPELSFSMKSSFFSGAGTLHFVATPTHLLEATCKSVRERMVWPLTDANSFRKIVAAGGGGLRFKDMFRETLQVELVPFKELQAALNGLLFLAEHHPPSGELFTVDEKSGQEVSVAWPSPLFPFILVSIGSGVSVIRVDSADSFTRVGGTACGGATFLGLARALTGESDFHKLMEVRARAKPDRAGTPLRTLRLSRPLLLRLSDGVYPCVAARGEGQRRDRR